MKSFFYHPKVQYRLKRPNLTPIKSMLNVFADAQQSHVYTNCVKAALKSFIKENYHSNKFLNYLLFGFSQFLNGILSSMWKIIFSTWESIFYLFEKDKYVCGKNFDKKFKGFLLLQIYTYHPIQNSYQETDTQLAKGK